MTARQQARDRIPSAEKPGSSTSASATIAGPGQRNAGIKSRSEIKATNDPPAVTVLLMLVQKIVCLPQASLARIAKTLFQPYVW
jgi:hypothetical protein